MVRFIFDSFGDSHHDIFVKMDVGLGGGRVAIADFYFVPDFLNFSSNTQDIISLKKECFEKFLEHFISIIGLDLEKTYLVFGLFDQCVSAIILEKFTRNKVIYYKANIVGTQDIQGLNINYKIKQDEYIKLDWKAVNSHSSEITKVGLLKGLQWSIENLKCKTPSINWEE